MRELTKWQAAMFMVGGIMMVVGAGCFVFMWQQKTMSWIFFAGVVFFSVAQMMQTYEGSELTLKRLKRLQIFADVLFIVAGLLMVDTAYQFLLPLFRNADGSGYYNYYNYVYNKWVIILLAAAMIELYTTHRINYELKKSKNT